MRISAKHIRHALSLMPFENEGFYDKETNSWSYGYDVVRSLNRLLKTSICKAKRPTTQKTKVKRITKLWIHIHPTASRDLFFAVIVDAKHNILSVGHSFLTQNEAAAEGVILRNTLLNVKRPVKRKEK